MSALAIRADGLTKIYRVGATASGYTTIREHLSPRRRREHASSEKENHTALNAVSFRVDAGETVGVVGVNGAGKTTLLKVLSRITRPTGGSAEVHGRVGCLLEAGAGFHPELSGRENVFLSGTILGMSAAAIRSRFDDIVEFSGVSKFLDTPVKRYSSGMYVRLGFAVAVHLDPEILIVDEVLAVGDAEFQRRCFAKIREVGERSRTVLFVSHNLAAMRSVCERALLLDRGELVADGPVSDVLDLYQGRIASRTNAWKRYETSNFVVDDVDVWSSTGPPAKTFEPLSISVRLTAKRNIGDPGLYVGMLTEWNERVAGLDMKDLCSADPLAAGDSLKVVFEIPRLPFVPGAYRLELYVKDALTQTFEQVAQAFEFEIAETPIYGGRQLDRWNGTTAIEGARATATRLGTLSGSSPG